MEFEDLLIKYPDSESDNYENMHREQYLTRQYFEEYISEIRSVFDGGSISIKKKIADKNGKAVDSKVEALVSLIVDRYFEAEWETRLYWTEKDKYYREFANTSEEAHKALERSAEIYRCFFYCALQGIVVSEQGEFRPVKTFGDLKELIVKSFSRRHNFINSREDLFFSDLLFTYNKRFTTFLETTRMGCIFLMKKHFAYTYTQAEKELCVKSFKQRYNVTEDFFNKYLDADHSAKMEKAAKHESIEAWVNSVADPEKFVQTYLRYRQLYMPSLARGRIPMSYDYTCMIDYYLDREKDTVFFIDRANSSRI